MGSSCADGILSTSSALHLCPALSSFLCCFGHCDYRTLTPGAENLSSLPLQGSALCLHPLQSLALPFNSLCCTASPAAVTPPWYLQGAPAPAAPLGAAAFPFALLLPCCRSSALAARTEPPALCNSKPWHKQQIIMTLHPARDRFPKGTLDTLPSL